MDIAFGFVLFASVVINKHKSTVWIGGSGILIIVDKALIRRDSSSRDSCTVSYDVKRRTGWSRYEFSA